MVDSIEFWYDYPSGPNLQVFEAAIARDHPSTVQYQGTKASPYFEVVLDPKLMNTINGISNPMQFLVPKKKCHIRMKRGGVTTAMGNFLLMNTSRMMGGHGTARRPLVKVSGYDWVSGILKRRVLDKASFVGSDVGALFGLGKTGNAKQVVEKLVADSEAIQATGISTNIGSQIQPGVGWPAISRDLSNRTVWDAIRAVADEVGADVTMSVATDELEMYGWRTKTSGKVYNDTHFSHLEYNENANEQSDEYAVGTGALEVIPRERIDAWITPTYWNTAGASGVPVIFDDGTGPEGIKTIGATYTGLPSSGGGHIVVFACQPPLASGSPGFFNLKISDIKEVRFMLSIAVTSGGIQDFRVILDQGDSTNLLLSSVFNFSSSTKLYDTFIGDNYTPIGNPTLINKILFAVRTTSTTSFTIRLHQVHVVYKGNQTATFTPVFPKTMKTQIDNSIRFVGDKSTKAARLGNILRSNNILVSATLNEPDLTLQKPGYTVQISSTKLEVLTPKDLRIEQIEHRFVNNRITTSFQTSEIAGVSLPKEEDKQAALRSLFGYGIGTPS